MAKSNSGETPSIHIGEKIRQLRMLHGLSLKALAKTVGCSESMLSKVETNRVNPGFGTLNNLVTALQTDFAYLFSVDDTITAPVSRPGNRPVISFDQIGRGTGIKMERLVPYATDHMLQANIHIISPRGRTEGFIQHVGEEVGLVLEGKLELTIGEEKHMLSAGDSFHFRSEVPHGYRNPGRTVTKIVWVNTPPSYYVRADNKK